MTEEKQEQAATPKRPSTPKLRNNPKENPDLPPNRDDWRSREFVWYHIPPEYVRDPLTGLDNRHVYVKLKGLPPLTYPFRVTLSLPSIGQGERKTKRKEFAPYECFAVDEIEAKAFAIQTYGIPQEEAYRAQAVVVKLDI